MQAPAGTAMAESQYTAPLVAVSPTSRPEDVFANSQYHFINDAQSRSISGHMQGGANATHHSPRDIDGAELSMS